MVSRTLTLIAALAALVIAGCGGSSGGQLSKADYTKQINEAGQALSKSFSSLGTDIGKSKDSKALGTKLTAGGKVLHDAADKIGAIKPPDNAKDANKKLVDGFNAMGDSFDKAGQSASGGNTTAVVTEIQGILSSPGVKLVNDAIKSLKAAGYQISSQ